jgi:hypothetical protein
MKFILSFVKRNSPQVPPSMSFTTKIELFVRQFAPHVAWRRAIGPPDICGMLLTTQRFRLFSLACRCHATNMNATRHDCKISAASYWWCGVFTPAMTLLPRHQ